MITYIIKQTNDELMNWYSSYFFFYFYTFRYWWYKVWCRRWSVHLNFYWYYYFAYLMIDKENFCRAIFTKRLFLNANSIYSHIEVSFLFLWLQKRSANWCFLIKCTLSRKCIDRAWNLITNVFVFCKAAT